MATLPGPAPTSAGVKRRARVLKSEFGDGYTQRVADGLNAIEHVWSVNWEGLTDSEADTLDNFLGARGGWEAFEWAPPRGAGTAVKWVCEEWERRPRHAGHADITATFRRVYDL